MRSFLILVLVCVLQANCAVVPSKKPMDMPLRYSVSGIISLPYAEVEEPFRAWYDETQLASRIDYYDGMVSTIQQQAKSIIDFGVGINISPMTDETVTNVKTCFWINGTKDDPMELQNVIPAMSDFTFVGETIWRGTPADQWENIVQVGDKKNVYTYYINARTGEPLFYEMLGYDSLLGSHYDRYYIEYFNYNTDAIEPSVFAITTSLQCRDFPGPGHKQRVLFNPMKQFIHTDDSHVHNSFAEFKTKHNKEYESELEHNKRLHTYRQNLRYIQSHNRQGKSFTLAINHLADKSDEELEVLRGRKKTGKNRKPNNGKLFEYSENEVKSLPDSFDWRIFGAVTPVKDQGICGSCWAFGTTETIEGAVFLKHQTLVRLSAQNLIDCSWGFGNNGCDGGEDTFSYDYIIKHGGLATEASYGQYLQANGYCHTQNATIGAQLTGYVNVTPYDAVGLKVALINNGPISIGIDAAFKSMVFYDNGVFYEPACGSTPDDLDHAVLLVGYGTIYNQDYWLVKNSWSTNWGNDGYILMSQKDNNCGVETSPTYPIVA